MLPDALLERPAFSLGGARKDALLLEHLNALTAHHRAACRPYARALDALWPGAHDGAARLDEVPWLPVQLFKTHELRSIPADDVFKTLTSSGTTGQARSRIFLDAASSARQTRALATVMSHVLGQQRLPMLVLDTRETVSDRRTFNARAAGILGMAMFGRDHCYALDADLTLRTDEVRAWLDKHAGERILVFGFTFMVWEALREAVGIDLSRATLIHSGGWKKLIDEAVDNATFKRTLATTTGLRDVRSFYGMVEQIGSVFIECSEGHLHAPNAADVVMRDPDTFEPAASGLVQVLSALPTSYPGHSLLTEDLGTVITRDGCRCGWSGAAIAVHGRVPKAELRGCSDTTAAGLAVAA